MQARVQQRWMAPETVEIDILTSGKEMGLYNIFRNRKARLCQDILSNKLSHKYGTTSDK